jgi:hypothetical protein
VNAARSAPGDHLGMVRVVQSGAVWMISPIGNVGMVLVKAMASGVMLKSGNRIIKDRHRSIGRYVCSWKSGLT